MYFVVNRVTKWHIVQHFCFPINSASSSRRRQRYSSECPAPIRDSVDVPDSIGPDYCQTSNFCKEKNKQIDWVLQIYRWISVIFKVPELFSELCWKTSGRDTVTRCNWMICAVLWHKWIGRWRSMSICRSIAWFVTFKRWTPWGLWISEIVEFSTDFLDLLTQCGPNWYREIPLTEFASQSRNLKRQKKKKKTHTQFVEFIQVKGNKL